MAGEETSCRPTVIVKFINLLFRISARIFSVQIFIPNGIGTAPRVHPSSDAGRSIVYIMIRINPTNTGGASGFRRLNKLIKIFSGHETEFVYVKRSP
jgi:hypothetical protein